MIRKAFTPLLWKALPKAVPKVTLPLSQSSYQPSAFYNNYGGLMASQRNVYYFSNENNGKKDPKDEKDKQSK